MKRPLAYFKIDNRTNAPWFVYKDRLTIDVKEEEKPFWNEIVKAVNAHDTLVSALKYYGSGCFDQGKSARKIVAKVEGK